MRTLVRPVVAAVAALALVAGCSDGDDAVKYSRAEADAAGTKHLAAAMSALPNLNEKPLGQQRSQFETAVKGTGMDVQWGNDTAVLTDNANRCASTFDLNTSDMTALSCGGTTYSQAEVETLILGSLVPAPK
jgi:hypothetical protein